MPCGRAEIFVEVSLSVCSLTGVGMFSPVVLFEQEVNEKIILAVSDNKKYRFARADEAPGLGGVPGVLFNMV